MNHMNTEKMNTDQTPIDENDNETMARVLADSGEPVAPPADIEENREDDLRAQLTAARALADRLGEALECDAMWGFYEQPPISMRCEYPTGGALTSGPNNCRDFYEKRKAALAAWKFVTKQQKDRFCEVFEKSCWRGSDSFSWAIATATAEQLSRAYLEAAK